MWSDAIKTIRSMLVSVLAIVSAGVLASAAGAQSSQVQPSSQDLNRLLAPIALYPDALIVQILQYASSPYQVNQVSTWLQQNPDLMGTAARDAAQMQGFDASFVFIVIFPDVLKMLADKPDWTRELGQAFTTNRDGVMASVQRLRKQAEAAGNFESTSQQTVQSVNTNGQQVIVIEPASTSSDGSAAAAAVIGFAAGVIVGTAADHDDDHYYYASGGWGYARPICYPGGYDDWYDHLENVANDYYDHRENMAGQRGENQAQRQDYRTDTRDTATQSQANRQQTRSDTHSSNVDTRSQSQPDRQQTRSDSRDTSQSSRQSAANRAQTDRGSTSSRGAYQSGNQRTTNRTGTSSGAFPGYQRGSTERAWSQRGQRSTGGRSGGSRR